ncbi:MAG: hypothetical protein MUO64_05925 [Anaerolineales bacterium]|nr:hypothetical protein [Anaerolineales bacterium]
MRDFLSFDRPLSVWTYALTTPFLGTAPLSRHIFALLTRWLSVSGMWWSLHGLWPHRTRQVTWMALMFAVYPIFTQQAISVIYGQAFVLYGLFFISLGAMLWSLRIPRYSRVLTVLALVTTMLHLVSVEYFVGLELLRPVFLWLALNDEANTKRARLRQVIKHWWPYLIVLFAYVIWRLFIVKLAEDTYAPTLLYNLVTNPIPTFLTLVQTALQDFIHISLTSWYNTIQPSLIDIGNRFIMFSWFIVFLTAIAIAVYILRASFDSETAGQTTDTWSRYGLFLGGYTILVGMLPVWLIERNLSVGYYSDRFSLAAMFGASILSVSLVYLITNKPMSQVVLLSALVGLAVGTQVRTSNEYRWDWVKQKNFYWQLYWRAPAIETGSAIISDDSIFTYVTRYSLSAAINTIYPQETGAKTQALWFFEIYDVIRVENHVPIFLDGMDLDYSLRNLSFSGSSKDSLIIYYEPEGRCLWVLNPNDATYIELPQIIREILPAANLARIKPDGAVPGYPPETIFGPEPAHTWCYYYQKADLARQMGDWEKVISLGEEAERLGVKPANQFEMIPFIEANAYLGNWTKAEKMSVDTYKKQLNMQAILCSTWDRIEVNTPANPQRDTAIANIDERVKCP